MHTQSSTSSHLAHSAAAREPPRPREVSRPQEVYRSHEVPDHRFEAPIYSNSDPSLSAPPVVPLPPQQQYLYSEVGGTTHLPLGPQSLGEPSYQANSYQPMPSYHSSAPAYPPEPFSRPLETYSYLPVESCMEFGGFATEYPASQEWVPSDQVYAQSGQSIELVRRWRSVLTSPMSQVGTTRSSRLHTRLISILPTTRLLPNNRHCITRVEFVASVELLQTLMSSPRRGGQCGRKERTLQECRN